MRSSNAAARGNIQQALKTDLSAFDKDQLLTFIASLNLDGPTAKERLAMIDALQNGNPDDRAAMSQYFLDMRDRRLERAVAVQF